MGALLGYARVSTYEQHTQLQLDALSEAGCSRIFVETASARADRPELANLFDHLRRDDTLVVWRLDRLGRSVRDLIEKVDEIHRSGANFLSLHETIDTSTAGGRLVFHLFAALAEFERDLIRERTLAGLAAARAQGRRGGRPRALTPEQALMARRAYESGDLSVVKLAEVLGVGRSTVYRTLHRSALKGS